MTNTNAHGPCKEILATGVWPPFVSIRFRRHPPRLVLGPPLVDPNGPAARRHSRNTEAPARSRPGVVRYTFIVRESGTLYSLPVSRRTWNDPEPALPVRPLLQTWARRR